MPSLRIDVLTLFPEMFSGYLGQSLLKRAIDAGIVDVQIHNIRDWAQGKHRQVDDRPFGGGPGMVMRPEPVVECVEAVQGQGERPGHLVLLSPQGRQLNQRIVEELAGHTRLVLICGRYEGVDQRVIDLLAPDELSIGDYILGGGEVAAMVVVDAVVRLVPGVLGDEDSNKQDSFSGDPPLLEFQPVHAAARVPRFKSARRADDRQPPGDRPLARRAETTANASPPSRFAS